MSDVRSSNSLSLTNSEPLVEFALLYCPSGVKGGIQGFALLPAALSSLPRHARPRSQSATSRLRLPEYLMTREIGCTYRGPRPHLPFALPTRTSIFRLFPAAILFSRRVAFLRSPAVLLLTNFGILETANTVCPDSGKSFVPYEIAAPIGAGDVGEVYRPRISSLGAM
jgi:hypothetical protein